MDSRKEIFRQTGTVALGQIVCCAVLVGVFALLGKYDQTVLFGSIAGAVLATANFFFLAVGAMMAADQAENQNVKGGQATIQASYVIRMVVLFVLLYALVKSGWCNVITTVLPLAFTRPILSLTEFFRK